MPVIPEDLQCILCNRCTQVCPQNMVNEKFSPRGLVLEQLIDGGEDNLLDNDSIWQCQTCLRCQDVCPQNTKWPYFVRDAREQARNKDVNFFCKHGKMMQTVQRMMTEPELKQNRLAWAEDLQYSEKGDYFYI